MEAEGRKANLPVRLWRRASAVSRAVLTWLLLGLVFILVFIPGRLVLTLLRRDPLKRGFPGKSGTGWVKVRISSGRYDRQFS